LTDRLEEKKSKKAQKKYGGSWKREKNKQVVTQPKSPLPKNKNDVIGEGQGVVRENERWFNQNQNLRGDMGSKLEKGKTTAEVQKTQGKNSNQKLGRQRNTLNQYPSGTPRRALRKAKKI